MPEAVDHVDRFREFAWFDVLANNTDRKGGHCLHDVANDLMAQGALMTLVFSPAQALLAAKAGANFISPFLGRIDDVGSLDSGAST